MKKHLFILVLLLAAIGWSCEKDTVIHENDYDVVVKSTETYRQNLNISGDEDGAVIIKQATHFEISELKRDSTTNWSVVYFYKPEAGFTGTDSVNIETNTGSNGASAGIKDTLKIVFLVTN